MTRTVTLFFGTVVKNTFLQNYDKPIDQSRPTAKGANRYITSLIERLDPLRGSERRPERLVSQETFPRSAPYQLRITGGSLIMSYTVF